MREKERQRASYIEALVVYDAVMIKGSKRKNLVIWLGLSCDEVWPIPHCPNVPLYIHTHNRYSNKSLEKCWQGN